jgi:hypothetical protein
MPPRKAYWAKTLIAFFFLLCSKEVLAMDSAQLYKKRKWVVGVGNGVAYTGTMTGLYHLWYKGYPQSSFKFFNDNKQWGQMDKIGHAFSCYYEGVMGVDMLKWAGVPRKKAIWLGGSYGFLIQSTIEVMDGFSANWGASWGDIAANAAGTGLVIGQELLWDEQRIWMKVLFAPTDYAPYRPELFGRSFVEQLFKDYNGQSYWLSANVASFLSEDSKWPKWLNVAAGYSINGFVGGDDNIYERGGVQFDYSHIPRSRQFYLAPDIDLTRIPVKKKGWKITFRILNCIKVPLPSIGYDSKGKNFSFNLINY